MGKSGSETSEKHVYLLKKRNVFYNFILFMKGNLLFAFDFEIKESKVSHWSLENVQNRLVHKIGGVLLLVTLMMQDRP